jgi:hypothetical protein
MRLLLSLLSIRCDTKICFSREVIRRRSNCSDFGVRFKWIVNDFFHLIRHRRLSSNSTERVEQFFIDNTTSTNGTNLHKTSSFLRAATKLS